MIRTVRQWLSYTLILLLLTSCKGKPAFLRAPRDFIPGPGDLGQSWTVVDGEDLFSRDREYYEIPQGVRSGPFEARYKDSVSGEILTLKVRVSESAEEAEESLLDIRNMFQKTAGIQGLEDHGAFVGNHVVKQIWYRYGNIVLNTFGILNEDRHHDFIKRHIEFLKSAKGSPPPGQ